MGSDIQACLDAHWPYYARSLSEVSRAMKLDEWRDGEPGAVSIEPLEVSRWRGDRDGISYGFSIVVVV